MIFTTDLQKDKSFVLVLSGDGRTEGRAFKSLAPRFNREKRLVWPRLPLPRKTGLKALEAVKFYTSRLGLGSLTFLFLIDHEYTVNEIQQDISEGLAFRMQIGSDSRKSFR